jgi:hypothetical protein
MVCADQPVDRRRLMLFHAHQLRKRDPGIAIHAQCHLFGTE